MDDSVEKKTGRKFISHFRSSSYSYTLLPLGGFFNAVYNKAMVYFTKMHPLLDPWVIESIKYNISIIGRI